MDDEIFTDRPLASIPFTDGVIRAVFLDKDGEQYVLDEDGNAVHGVWIHIDEPFIVGDVADHGEVAS